MHPSSGIRTPPGAAEPFPCHACDRSFPTLAALRVHAVVDERRVLTPAEQTSSAQLSLFLHTAPDRGGTR